MLDDPINGKRGGQNVVPANYGTRAIAFILDVVFAIVPGVFAIVLGVGGVFSDSVRGVGVVFIISGILWILTAWFFNDIWRQGRTGATFGKKRMGISLVKSATGEPIGVGLAFIRWGAVWFFNSLSFGLYILADLLAPAFTERRQRITDKMLSSEVIVGAPVDVRDESLPPPLAEDKYAW